MENSWYVRQNKTGSNRDVKILIADILSLWMVSGVVSNLAPFIPKSWSEAKFHKFSGIWSVNWQWKVHQGQGRNGVARRLEFSGADQVSRPQAAVIESKKWLGDKESWRKNLNKHRSNRSVALPSASGCFDWTCLYYLQIGEKHGACQLMECSLALLHGRAHGMAHNTSRLHIWHIGRMNLSIFEIKWWSRKTASCSADRTMLNFIIKTANYKVYPGRKR